MLVSKASIEVGSRGWGLKVKGGASGRNKRPNFTNVRIQGEKKKPQTEVRGRTRGSAKRKKGEERVAESERLKLCYSELIVPNVRGVNKRSGAERTGLDIVIRI